MRTRRPISINNSLVHGICNYSCPLCAVNKPSYCGPKAFQSVDVTQKLIARVEQAADQGIYVRYLANAGDGEPTLHPQFVQHMQLFGAMRRRWSSSIQAPEVSVVTNGANLHQTEILETIADNVDTLIVSFPTVHAEDYGQIMLGKPEAGSRLLQRVIAGVERAMHLAATGRLGRLVFHISPPDREKVRRGFAKTVDVLSRMAQRNNLESIEMTLFPATSNRSGLVRKQVEHTDFYKDLRRLYQGRRFFGVEIHMEMVHKRFFARPAELIDLLRSFAFPCLWNANLFIAADGHSICCNDQAVQHPFGNILHDGVDKLIERKEQYQPDAFCRSCDQDPRHLTGSAVARLYSLAARLRVLVGMRLPRFAALPAKRRSKYLPGATSLKSNPPQVRPS